MNKSTYIRAASPGYEALLSAFQTLFGSLTNPIKAKIEASLIAIMKTILWFKQQNSAIADKPRDAFVQIEWRGSPPKTRPSPYVLPRPIWSFCVKECRHKRRTPKFGER